MFFLQMSGYPGSGKSTLARAIALRTGAVIVDHDIVKTALLNSLDTVSQEPSLDPKLTGAIGYDIDWALVDFHLSLGQNVILDSPCLYTVQLDRGTALSDKHRVQYKYVECFLGDQLERDNRLRNRQRLRSQVAEVHPSMKHTMLTIETSKMIRPAHHPYLIVDTSQPLDSYIDEVMAYLKE
jgi:predicted kinase